MKSYRSRVLIAGLMASMAAGAMAPTDGEASENPGAKADPAPKVDGIGDVAKRLIREGLGNKETLEAIKDQFPEAKTTMASVNWYRNYLRSEGEDVKTAREIAAKDKPSGADVKAEKAAAKEAAKADKAKAAADEKAKKAADKAAKVAADKAAKAAAKAAPKEPAGELGAALA